MVQKGFLGLQQYIDSGMFEPVGGLGWSPWAGSGGNQTVQRVHLSSEVSPGRVLGVRSVRGLFGDFGAWRRVRGRYSGCARSIGEIFCYCVAVKGVNLW